MDFRRKASLTLVACVSGVALYTARKNYLRRKSRAAGEEGERGGEEEEDSTFSAVQDFMKKKKKNAAVNRAFLKQLFKLLRISIPSVLSKEFLLLVFHTASLVARTFLSIYVAHLDGRLVKSIVDRKPYTFLRHCLTWLLLALPATFVNSLIRYLESKLALAIRTQLVDYAYSLYFKNQTYYRVSNLDGRLTNPDHSLTEDVQAFSAAVTHIYSHVSKPLLDVVLMSGALSRLAKKKGENSPYPPMIGFGMIFFTGWILRMFSPAFGKLVAEEARRSGYLRHVHSRLITNAEEVAFYGGHKVSEHTLYPPSLPLPFFPSPVPSSLPPSPLPLPPSLSTLLLACLLHVILWQGFIQGVGGSWNPPSPGILVGCQTANSQAVHLIVLRIFLP